MADRPRSYALVTPARNEAANLRRLADSVTAQTRLPARWVIVDDGSDDETPDIARGLAAAHPWIALLPRGDATADALGRGRRQGRDVLAFNAGVESLDPPPDVVVKLDADVSLAPEFFAELLLEFERDPLLGIAGGICLELEGGRWVPRHSTGGHVRGATRAYRWTCLQAVQPLATQVGWDGIDELRATALGWRTRTIARLPFRHHRAVGQRDGMRRAYLAQGEAAHYMGYRPSYLIMRTLFRARRDVAALAMVWGYFAAAARRRPRCPDPLAQRELRSQQRLRSLPVRALEAAGRRSPRVYD
jgi:glycosyltransferase involved in cell wall biosynthesis